MIPDPALSPVLAGVTASLLAGLATGAGALPALFIRRISDRAQNAMLGFSAGVMLAASFFSLILPGLEAAETQGAGRVGAASIVVVGVLIGAAALWLIHRYAPHEHFVMGREGPQATHVKRIWLFVVAITLHNFPEGLAVGVGFGSEEPGRAIALAVGIGLQNMPEGLAMAVALLTIGYGRGLAFATAALTGLVEPLGGLLGVGAVTLAAPLLPWGLAFAAGAMIFVISDEIIPETHRQGFSTQGTAGLMSGLAVMMFLDATLG